MTLLISTALFLLGVYLSMRVIAALYRIRDLWYTIGTAYPKVARGILGWAGTTVAIAVLLSDRRRPAFLSGLAAFVAFYLSGYALGRLLLWAFLRIGGKGGGGMAVASGPSRGRPGIREEIETGAAN